MKKLFGVRPKLSYYKVFHRKFISNRNEKTKTNKQKKQKKQRYLSVSHLFRTFRLSIQEFSKILM